MRFHEFLVEYDENKNWSIYGPKILNKFKKDRLAKRFYSGFDDEQIRKAWDNVLRFADPTPNLEYAKWISIIFVNTPAMLEDIDGRLKSALKNYHTFKIHKLLQPEERDIYKIRTIQDLENIVIKYKIPQAEIKDKGRSKELYNGRDCRIIVPLDEQAAIYYGQGTKWCTAATESDNMFSEYPEPLYIIIPKHQEYLGEKYQFYFSSDDLQFMNEQDESITERELFNLVQRMPGIKVALKEEFLKYKYYVIFNDDELREEQERIIQKISTYNLNYIPSLGLYTGRDISYGILKLLANLRKIYIQINKESYNYFDVQTPMGMYGNDYKGYFIIDPNVPIFINFKDIDFRLVYSQYMSKMGKDNQDRKRFFNKLNKLSEELLYYSSLVDYDEIQSVDPSYTYEDLQKLVANLQNQFYQYLKTGSDNAST